MDAAGSVIDKAWSKYALEFFRALCEEDGHLKRRVFSIGPSFETAERDFLRKLSAFMDQGGKPDQIPAEHEEFQFTLPCASPKLADQGGDEDDVWQEQGGILLFAVVSTRPRDVKVAPLVQKASDASSIIVRPIRVVMCDPSQRLLDVSLEDLEGTASGNLYHFSMANLQVGDLSSLRSWKLSPTPRYRLKGGDSDIAGSVTSEVLRLLCNARKTADDGMHVFLKSQDTDNSRHDCLKDLRQRGFVSQHTDSDSESAWCLTKLGLEGLRVSVLLEEPDVCLRPRPIPVEDMCVFELMCVMQREVWACAVKPPARRRKAKLAGKKAPDADSLSLRPTDFVRGGELQWWVEDKPIAPSVCREYLLALLDCQRGGGKVDGPVAHFRPAGYYKALLAGMVYNPRKRQQEFDFALPSSAPPPEPKGRAMRSMKRPGAKRAKAALAGLWAGSVASLDGDENSGGEGDDGSAHDTASSDGSGGSSSSSSSSGSRSSSSESSSSGPSSRGDDSSGGDVALLGGCGPGLGAPDGVAQELRASGSQDIDDVPSGGVWKGFKFTQTFFKGTRTPMGWEATCYLEQHRMGTSNPCRRTRNIGKGTARECQRRLKWWCAQVYLAQGQCRTRKHHVHTVGEPSTLPSLAELEALPFEVDRRTGALIA